MNDRSHIIGFSITAVIAPLFALGAFQFFLSEPSSARAGVVGVGIYPLPIIPSSPGEDELGLKGFGDVSSPFWFVKEEIMIPEAPIFHQPIKQTGTADPVFVLSSVLPSPIKSYAVVNGKARSQGDEIEPGWILLSIDGSGRSIILQHTTGRKLRVMMKRN